MSAFTVSLDGVPGLAAKLRAWEAAKTRAVADVVDRFTRLVAREAQGRAPYDMGELRAGIRPVLDAVARDLVGSVVSEADHSPFVEFGTGSRVSVPGGLESYAREFYVSGKGRMPAQPFLFPALESQRGAFARALAAALRS